MRSALSPRKCHLHFEPGYDGDVGMEEEVAERLRNARVAAGYSQANDAAVAMRIPNATYTQHENGRRRLKPDAARRYARFFRTTPEWILYGRGSSGEPTVDELEAMIRDVLSEVLTFDVKIADLPRIVAPSLHEQLARFRADRKG
jgi:transcriptional regulator with XRE-family HTH domain